MFLLYLKLQSISIKINDNGLVALALLIAESNPAQKDLMIKYVWKFRTKPLKYHSTRLM